MFSHPAIKALEQEVTERNFKTGMLNHKGHKDRKERNLTELTEFQEHR
jgi:hypothetical protein